MTRRRNRQIEMKAAHKILVFDTYRKALQSYQPRSCKAVSPFRVKKPPQVEDFEAHGHFREGELSIEALTSYRWGGSFGDPKGVEYRWSSNRCVHNHPLAKDIQDAVPSWHDIRTTYRGETEMVASSFGIFHLKLPFHGPKFHRWPKEIHASAVIRSQRGRVQVLESKVMHKPWKRVHNMLEGLFLTVQDTREKIGERENLFVAQYPAGYGCGSILLGEIAFVVWDHFPALFHLFGKDPFQLLDPRKSWGRFFQK